MKIAIVPTNSISSKAPIRVLGVTDEASAQYRVFSSAAYDFSPYETIEVKLGLRLIESEAGEFLEIADCEDINTIFSFLVKKDEEFGFCTPKRNLFSLGDNGELGVYLTNESTEHKILLAREEVGVLILLNGCLSSVLKESNRLTYKL